MTKNSILKATFFQKTQKKPLVGPLKGVKILARVLNTRGGNGVRNANEITLPENCSLKRPGHIIHIFIHLDVYPLKALENRLIHHLYAMIFDAQHHTLGVFGIHPHEQPPMHGIAYEQLHHHAHGYVESPLIVGSATYALGQAEHHGSDGPKLRLGAVNVKV